MIKYIVALIMLSTLLISGGASAKDDAVNTGWFNNTAIKGYDSVAYFTQNKAVKGSDKYTFSYLGADWHFSSEENKTTFAENPKRYAPQYGGWCAYAMADEGNAVGIDPEAFYIHEDKLYLNYSQSVQQKWLSNLLPYIVMADGYYPQTTNVMTFQ
ncbi:MAG TPA: YHS domain-containing protein [Pseudoalteromonas sp.]|uniref:YHS domain-containing (seleno)protein n=1 Tax=unclassified Pseudoalteromonas TaxID=194690 RepID=UPI000976A8CE|nr:MULTISPECIES: YHS domain-containing (seleno)protein [unclassified Pseudoalteromonas]HDY93057.1 YHS domain-containing protein [Pseudoalteromonas sp.]HDZ33617.1 YHS domain-containing protein [Pseudoalteromonas sp.]